MSHGYQRSADVGDYTYFHINATIATAVAVGRNVATTSATTISAGNNVVVTPASMANIEVGMYLNFNGGAGTTEDVQVLSVTGTTFTANFVNGHSGAYTISSYRPTFLKDVIVGSAGTSVTITLYDGHPSARISKVISAIQPVSTRGDYPFVLRVEHGLFVTVSGTPGDYTLQYIDGTV